MIAIRSLSRYSEIIHTTVITCVDVQLGNGKYVYILHTLCLTLNKTVIIAYCGVFTLYNKATYLFTNELMTVDTYTG